MVVEPSMGAVSARPLTVVVMVRVHVRRIRRGFTTLETAIALALSSAILIALVLWVSSLMRTTTTAIEMVALDRDARSAVTRLENDLVRLGSCTSDGTAPVIVQANETSFGFYADVVDSAGIAGFDEVPDFVLWEVSGSELRRAVVPGTGVCPASPLSPSSYLVFAADTERSDLDPFFTLYRNGTAATAEENCLQTTQFCRFDVLRFRAVITDTGPGSNPPTQIDETFDLRMTGQRV